TGKSNLFEALIEILRHICEYDKDKNELGFDYLIEYEVDGRELKVKWTAGKFIINNRTRKTIGKTPLPDNILIYYSGHNSTVKALVNEYEGAFQSRIRSASFEESRRFIGIGPEYKELLLSVLLLQENTNKARKFVCQKLGIKSTASEMKLILKRPSYAADSRFDIEYNDESDRYWKAEGITKDFLSRLTNCISTKDSGPIRSEGYFPSDDRYILYLDIARIRLEFNDITPQELFRQFDNLKTLHMIAAISIPIALESGVEASVAHFSDGQFQSVYIYSIVELFKDRNCITLLDEPDSFLHPEWQWGFLKQISAITGDASEKNHILMSSHSAVTLINHQKNKVKFFDVKNHQSKCNDLPKRIAIEKLSSKMIKYSEKEQLLSIINAIQIENKPVLFTEGSTDPIIIKEAWYKLFEEEMPFIPFYAFSCTYIKQLLTDDRIHSEMGGLPVFALFDFDKAYDQWNGLRGEITKTDPMAGLVKKWDKGESYALMLPIPSNEEIQRQVIKDIGTLKTFGGDSYCEIEHLFYGHTDTESYYHREPCSGGSRIAFKSDKRKTTFAKDVVPNLPRVRFEVFRPMLDFIKSKCSSLVTS
ncbi:MAG: AAA family ATPase, partial [Cyanobacteria bacterium J06631_12]